MADIALLPQHFANVYKGGETKLAPGRYVTTRPIVISGAKGFDLRGEGVTLVGQIELVNCSDFRIYGFAFDGDRKARGDKWDKPSLRITGCSDWQIDNAEFVNARGDHLYIAGGSTLGVLRDSAFIDAWRNAISVINGNCLLFEGLTISNVNGTLPMAGIDIEANGDGTGDDPLGCNHDIAIEGCKISNVGGRSILGTGLNPPVRVSLKDNTLSGPVTLLGDEHHVIDNRIDGHMSNEIGVGVRGNRCRVEDNTIENGMFLAALIAGKDNVVEGNVARNYATSNGESIRVETV